MASEIRMPRLGWTMEEGTFGEWLKEDGAEIKSGDLLFVVESDKAAQEVESFDSGILRIPPESPQPGDIVPVGALMAYVVKPGEAAPFEGQTESTPTQPDTDTSQSEYTTPADPVINTSTPTRSSRNGQPAISPRARRIAGELNVEWAELTGSGRTGRIVERDVRAAHAQAAAITDKPEVEKIRVTPVAQRMAQETGVDLAQLASQHPGERIGREHVEAAVAAHSAHESVRSDDATRSVPVTRIRHLIAERMTDSAQATAAVTLTTEADATGLVALREELKATFAPRALLVPSYNALLIKLTAVALQEHPLLNATWSDKEILVHEAIHIGLAVDKEGGLTVPIVRNVQSKSIRQITAETQELIQRVQTNQITPDELQSGTFTITNLGMYGIDAFTPIINLPQCAILGVGRIHQKPAVYDGQVVPRQMMALSLTFDHRVVDGGPAARFLNTIREYVEAPALWLVA